MATPESGRKPWHGPFLEALSRLPNVSAAARAAGIDRVTAYRERSRHPEFAELWDDALETSIDLMEQVATRRATVGEPFTETREYQRLTEGGEMVTVERVTSTGTRRSDTLLIFLLKAHRPERYRETWRTELTGADGGPIKLEAARVDAAVQRFNAEVLRLVERNAEAGGIEGGGERGDPA